LRIQIETSNIAKSLCATTLSVW